MRLLLTAGSVGAVLFVVTFLVDGATRPGYDARRHAVSALATGPRGWLQTANFVLCGVLVAGAVPGVFVATGSVWLAGGIGVVGLSLVASGVFPMDPMRGYPPGTPEGTPDVTSRRHELHDLAGGAVFTSLPASAVIAALTLDDTAWAVASAVTAVVFTTASVRFASAWEADDPRTGLLQRVAIVVGWAWLAGLCLHLAG